MEDMLVISNQRTVVVFIVQEFRAERRGGILPPRSRHRTRMGKRNDARLPHFDCGLRQALRPPLSADYSKCNLFPCSFNQRT